MVEENPQRPQTPAPEAGLESAAPEGAGKKRRKLDGSDVFAALFVLAILIGVPLFIYRTCTATSPLREETRAFCKALRTGKLQDAHGLLAPSRRSRLPFQRFVKAVKGTALRSHHEVKIEGTKKDDQGWGCTRGALLVGKAEWAFELYLVKEGKRWRPHTWALHPPASITPMPLMSRCGSW